VSSSCKLRIPLALSSLDKPELTLVGSDSNEAFIISTSKWRVYPSRHATMNDGLQCGQSPITAPIFLQMPQTPHCSLVYTNWADGDLDCYLRNENLCSG
jgi:hypothetical protein